MLQLILKFVTQNALKGAGGYLMAHGYATQDQWTAIAGFIVTMVGLGLHWYQMHSHAVATGAVASPALSPKMMAPLIALLLLPALLCGCNFNRKDVAHVWTASQDGTTVGVTENPTTQLYELGVKRVHSHITMIPIIFETNAMGNIRAVIPDVVVSDEINARSGIFGGAGGTITVATGTNAVQTILGGQHQPINTATGTNLPK